MNSMDDSTSPPASHDISIVFASAPRHAYSAVPEDATTLMTTDVRSSAGPFVAPKARSAVSAQSTELDTACARYSTVTLWCSSFAFTSAHARRSVASAPLSLYFSSRSTVDFTETFVTCPNHENVPVAGAEP